MGGLVRRWTALDGSLVFEFDSDGDGQPGPTGRPVSLVISAGPDPHDTRTVILEMERETRIDVRFGSGCHVRGLLRWRHGIPVDGIVHSGIFADVRFGPGPGDDRHVEGMMVSWPARNSSPPDPPRPQPPPPFDPPE